MTTLTQHTPAAPVCDPAERTRKARARRAALVATKQRPAPTSDVGRVLAAVERWPGLPTWAIARNIKMCIKRVTGAAYHLRKQGFIVAHRTEYRDPRTGVERVMRCWFRSRAAAAVIDSTRCQQAMGYGATCGTRLVDAMTAFGRVTWHCPACERRNAGQCRTCPRPTKTHSGHGPRPWFCESCLAERRRNRSAVSRTTPEYRTWHRAWQAKRRKEALAS